MNVRKIMCIVLASALLLLTGCAASSPQEDISTEGEPEKEKEQNISTDAEGESDQEKDEEKEDVKSEEKKSYSVLFIGNSYTYYQDMPKIFEFIGKTAGYDVTVTSITNGGHTLAKMADPSDTYGAKVEEALSGATKYDYVVLQEQSVRPASSAAGEFYKAVRNLAERVRATGAEPILYATWGRKTGSETLTDYGWTNESMTWKLAAAYAAIGEELNIPVAHVGLAFYDVYTGSSGTELYSTDKSHPAYTGSYLAAATLFAKIFEADPTDVSYKGNLPSRTAAELRKAAAKAVFETPEIPDAYKTSSEGVGK